VDQRIIDLYDEYTHAPLDRRVFLERLAALAGGSAAAAAILPLLEARRAAAAAVAPDDPRVASETAVYQGKTGEVRGYLARPAEGTGLPAVMIVHENRGLNAHIEDVTRRMALAGFLAYAPDFLSPAGGTPDDEDRAREMIQGLDPADTTADAVAGIAFLKGHPLGNGRAGAVGFCWGGGVIGRLAVADADLDAGVVFYGQAPDPADAARIKAPLLLHYAGLDERINARVPAFREALAAAGVEHTVYMYEGANHAFHNDTSPGRYDAEAAALAWQRTIDFFTEKLGAS
jgi:carboxymethylenebutenolidase